MNKLFISTLLGTALLASSCNNEKKTTDNNDIQITDSLPPVESGKANTNYKPAFEGQTRMNGVKTSTPYESKVITNKLKSPWGIAVLPDGRLLITEKADGVLRIVSIDGSVSEAITGLPAVDNDAQGGLLGITLDPDFASNKTIYWAFSEPVSAGNHTAVAKGVLADDEKSIVNAKVIYRTTPTYKGKLHYGGRLIFDKTGHLILTSGERSDMETRPLAQDLKSTLGKLIRITKEGQPAADNPFFGRADVLPEILSYGHRNPQGIAFHPETGDLWEAEFGPRGGDELNRIAAGKNYGWPTITYGIEYGGAEIGTPPIQAKEGMEQPVYYWDPVLSPAGMTFYTADAIPEWKNNLFIGGLSSTHIARLIIKDNKVVGEERLLAKEGERFRDVVQGNNGELFAVTDGGKLYSIAKK
ncbi:PQQ-dependent sugar dehydrogenase [Sphingobacterium bovistauri]|nr:PQQ-dependent sugar dehydrogenase [Sphingobacterium bovistauri]